MMATIMPKKEAWPNTCSDAGSSMRTKLARKTTIARKRCCRAIHFARFCEAATNEGGES